MTDSDNTFATSKEMTRTYPDQSLDLSNHFKKLMVVYGLSLHLGSSESRKIISEKFIFQIGTLNPHGQVSTSTFQLHFLHRQPAIPPFALRKG